MKNHFKFGENNIKSKATSKQYSNNKKDFISYQFDTEIDVELDKEMKLCPSKCIIFEKNGELFLPKQAGIEATDSLILFERKELAELLENRLVAVELVLKSKEEIMINYCYQEQE